MLAQVLNLQNLVLPTANDRVYAVIDDQESMKMNTMGNAGDCLQLGL